MDASVGLTFSLQLFQRYQRNGLLQAKIRHMPGIQGPCTAYVHLTKGFVTACYLENKQGQQLPFSIEDLCRIDNERGPFEWTFQPQPSPSHAQMPSPSSPGPFTWSLSSSLEQEALIPRIIAPLHWEQFEHWTPEQKLLLQHVWKSIDGKRTLQEVRASLPYPPQVVHEIVQILLAARIIVLAS